MHEAEAQSDRDPVSEPAAAPRVEEDVREQAPRLEVRPVEAPRVDPKEILSSSGLQMVETDSSKARQPVPESEPVQLGRPRREKPAQPAILETELVQVETRNK
jgi:DNA polymerase-3 subunit gamma/tau